MTQPQSQSLGRRLFAPKPVAPTLGRQVARAVARALLLAVLLGGPVVLVHSLPGAAPFGVGDLDYATPEEGAGGAVVDTPAERLLAEHAGECWQGGETPLADLPSAAIVRFTMPPAEGEVIWTDLGVDVHDAFAEVLAQLGVEGEGIRETRRFDVVALCVLPDQVDEA